MAKAEVEREMERLSKLGYEFEIVPDPRIGDGEEIVADGENKYSIYSGFAVKGNLTGEQLSRFESEVKQNLLFSQPSTEEDNIQERSCFTCISNLSWGNRNRMAKCGISEIDKIGLVNSDFAKTCKYYKKK